MTVLKPRRGLRATVAAASGLAVAAASLILAAPAANASATQGAIVPPYGSVDSALTSL